MHSNIRSTLILHKLAVYILYEVSFIKFACILMGNSKVWSIYSFVWVYGFIKKIMCQMNDSEILHLKNYVKWMNSEILQFKIICQTDEFWDPALRFAILAKIWLFTWKLVLTACWSLIYLSLICFMAVWFINFFSCFYTLLCSFVWIFCSTSYFYSILLNDVLIQFTSAFGSAGEFN
jgi:hypothetical protein